MCRLDTNLRDKMSFENDQRWKFWTLTVSRGYEEATPVIPPKVPPTKCITEAYHGLSLNGIFLLREDA